MGRPPRRAGYAHPPMEAGKHATSATRRSGGYRTVATGRQTSGNSATPTDLSHRTRLKSTASAYATSFAKATARQEGYGRDG
jgi:hypothetical protein